MYYVKQALFLLVALTIGGLLFSAGVYLTHLCYFIEQPMHATIAFIGPLLIVAGAGITATGVIETHN